MAQKYHLQFEKEGDGFKVQAAFGYIPERLFFLKFFYFKEGFFKFV
ncbi:hypothetical protein HNR52_002045 [Thermoanaerobacterium thermosulfurigenes]